MTDTDINETRLAAGETDREHKQLTTGTLLKDRFELLEEIGRGGMGTVYKALDKRDIEAEHSNFLAVKVLNDELGTDSALLKALHNEAKKSQELAHPNIVTVYDFDRESDHVFMTMEYMDGVSLDQVIRGHPDGLPLEQALRIIDQIGAALAYAHSRHIIHSDFKPSNVFLGHDKRVKVIDFGIARVVKSERREKFDAGSLRGLTPAYASLEMFRDQEPDPKDDIYALACVAYELLTGRHPYDHQRADSAKHQALVPQKPRKLGRREWRVLRSGLQLERDRRLGDVTAFYQGLHTKSNTLPLYLTASLISLALLLWLWDPISSYWQTLVDTSSPTTRDHFSGTPAVFSATSRDCLAQARVLLTIRLETQTIGTIKPQRSLDNPDLSAHVYQAIKPFDLNLIGSTPEANDDLAEHRRFKPDYRLTVSVSAREAPITVVGTEMKTIQGRITLELLQIDTGRILNTVSAEFKQPGLNMLEIVDNNVAKNIGDLSSALLQDWCSREAPNHID